MVRGQLLIGLLVVLAAFIPAAAIAQTDTECTYPIERTDATGVTVEITEPAKRVVTLSPSAAQTMWEIGAWEKVVGASKYASNLKGFDTVENVSGAGQTINSEAVVDLEPDLVLAPNVVNNDTVRKLREAGLTIFRFHEAATIEDIKADVQQTGRFVGTCDGAAETVSWMDSRLAVVDETAANQPKPTALYVFFGFTAGDNTFINQLIQRAGAVNGAANANITGYKQLNQEILVPMNPDWLVLNSDWTTVPKTAAYNSTRAVKEGQVVVVNTNHLNRPAPRVVYAVERMAKAFHPSAYAAANASTPTPPVATSTQATPVTPTVNQEPESTTPGADGSGFGLLLAILAPLVLVFARQQ